MEGEIKTMIKVWILATICLCYCYYIASKIPKGFLRLISLLPVFYLFIVLPFELKTFHFCSFTTFYLTWLATFKLILFSFDQPPLSPLSSKLFHFISLVCLPIKLKHETVRDTQNLTPKLLLLVIKIVLLVSVFHSYNYKQFMHPYILLAVYCMHIYLELELLLALTITPARVLFGFELEPQFNEPYLATSLQDFWGYRWNLMVTKILRPTVYIPIKRLFDHVLGPKWASLIAVFATFVVSGIMHEVLFFYITRANPTWEVTWFFVLHGICLPIEVLLKKMVKGLKWSLHPMISRLLAFSFVCVTTVWLFLPQLIRNGIMDKIVREYSIFLDFVKQRLADFSFLVTI